MGFAEVVESKVMTPRVFGTREDDEDFDDTDMDDDKRMVAIRLYSTLDTLEGSTAAIADETASTTGMTI